MSTAARVRKTTAQKTKKGLRLSRTQPKSGKKGLPSLKNDPPEWAREAVYDQALMVAWEGTLHPFKTTNIYPKSGLLVSALSTSPTQQDTDWSESIHPLDKNRTINAFQSLKTAPFTIEYRLVAASGEFFWVSHSVTALEKKGRLVLAKGFVRNIQTEKELELESLRISEREQNRIGQDLHDDLCQVLAGVSCLMRVAEGRLAAKVPEEVPAVNELNQQIIDAMHRTRALTHGLFPGKVQIADVRGALLELAAQVKARFQVEVKTEFAGRFPHHTKDQIIHIYRLTQEAVSNAIKHGHATCIEVRLEAKNANMCLSIIDNGTGLSKEGAGESGVGRHIMNYRSRILGGEFTLRNAPGRGVAVTLTYPYLH